MKAKVYNATRWSSVADMLKRYCDLHSILREIDIDGIEELILTKSEKKKIDELCFIFLDLDSVTKHMQSASCTLAYVRVLFDGVIETYPET